MRPNEDFASFIERRLQTIEITIEKILVGKIKDNSKQAKALGVLIDEARNTISEMKDSLQKERKEDKDFTSKEIKAIKDDLKKSKEYEKRISDLYTKISDIQEIKGEKGDPGKDGVNCDCNDLTGESIAGMMNDKELLNVGAVKGLKDFVRESSKQVIHSNPGGGTPRLNILSAGILSKGSIGNINFTNAIVTPTADGVDIDTSATGATVQYQDEGTNLGVASTVDTVNFTGGIVATRTGNTITVTDFAKYRSLSANTTLSITADGTVFVDATLANITLTLPTAIGNGGVFFTIKKTNATGFNVILSSSQLIEGNSSFTFPGITLRSSFTVISDGSNWWIK